jgi:mono/diheme cytochrome c family protein
MGIVVLMAVCLGLLLSPSSAAVAQPLFGGGHEPLAGARVFGSNGCVTCHAIRGLGGTVGPDLARIARPRSFFDLATALWNHLPRMAERMELLGIPRPRLGAREAGDLVAFLYTLGYFDEPGNPEQGSRLFLEKRCIVCHQAGGAGGVVGPVLDPLRHFGSPMYLTAAMWNHGPAMIEAMREKGVERPRFTGLELRDLVAFLLPRSLPAAEGPLYVLPGRAREGRKLFAEKRCAQCHSAAGTGGQGAPDLVDRLARRSPIEFAAAMWNKAPAMVAAQRARGLPIPQLRPEEMADIVAYLYSIRYFSGPGSVAKGWTVAASKGCLTCHAARGEKGKPAGDLGRIGGLDSPPAVIAALWSHAIVTPRTSLGQDAPWPEFRPHEMADLVAFLGSLADPR